MLLFLFISEGVSGIPDILVGIWPTLNAMWRNGISRAARLPDHRIRVPREGDVVHEVGQNNRRDGRHMQRGLGLLQLEEAVPGRVRYNGQAVDLADISEELVIVSKREGEGSQEQAFFAEQGDCGSFVLDHEAQVCGLLYGAVAGYFDRYQYHVNAGLVMNLPDLSASVKLRTAIRNDNDKVQSVGDLGIPC